MRVESHATWRRGAWAAYAWLLAGAIACDSAGGGEAGDNRSNPLFRVSEDAVHFDSRDDHETATLEIEGLRDGLVLSARTVTGDDFEALTKEPRLEKTDSRHAKLTITRSTPDAFEPGDRRGRVLVRGCVGDECEDAFIAIGYHVVRLLIDREVLTLRQQLGETVEDGAEIQLSLSDGSDSPWTASMHYGTEPDAHWLSVPEAGDTLRDPVRLQVDPPDQPGHHDAWVRFQTDAGAAMIQVTLQLVRGLAVDAEQLKFEARVGETPAAQTLTLSDTNGEAYRWEAFFTHTDNFQDRCTVYNWLNFRPPTGATLPTQITLQAAPMSVADSCTGTLDILIDGVVTQSIPMRYEVSQ